MPWVKGQSGNPLGPMNVTKPFRDALRMALADIEDGRDTSWYPKGSLRWNALQLVTKGDVTGIKELADRLDGKVPQTLGQSEEHGPMAVHLYSGIPPKPDPT